MVVSLAYLLTELDSKVKYHTAQLGEIDCKADRLSRQAVSIESKVDEDIDLFIEELLKRKEVLKETLWQIVAREDKQFAKKKAEIMERVKVLRNLENIAFEDGMAFRELYGNAIERSSEFDIGSNGDIDLKVSADCQKVIKAIIEFGTISYDVCQSRDSMPLPDDQLSHVSTDQGHYFESDFELLGKEEVPSHGAEKNVPSDCPDSASDLLFCDLSNCCNCIDVCEEKGVKIAESQMGGKSAHPNWQQWLWKPKGVSSIVGSEIAFENKIVSQLESLQLSQSEETAECKKQEVFTAQFHEDLQYWLASKQRGLSHDENEKMDAQVPAVDKVWNEIRARSLFSWLKPEFKPDLQIEEKTNIHGNFAQIDSIQSSEPGTWLKDIPPSKEAVCTGSKMEIEDSNKMPNGNLAQYEEIRSSPLNDWLKVSHPNGKEDKVASRFEKDFPKDEVINYGVWLKRKCKENYEESETQTTKLYKRIKSTPLENWLKGPESQRYRKKSGTGKSTTVNKAHEITRVPLESWLKRMKISENVEQKKYADWLVPQSKSQRADPCGAPQSAVFQQFDKIAKSSLSGWIKKAEKVPKSSCLCKWLKSGSLEGCKSCKLSLGASLNILF